MKFLHAIFLGPVIIFWRLLKSTWLKKDDQKLILQNSLNKIKIAEGLIEEEFVKKRKHFGQLRRFLISLNKFEFRT